MWITECHELMLRVTSPGDLLPWIGPALRGLVAGRLKSQVCQQPRSEQETRWKHCTGCQHAPICAYARLFEPDAASKNGTGDLKPAPSRPVVLAPYFPVPDCVDLGDEIPLRITIIGEVESCAWDGLLEAVKDVGRKPGIGPDLVTYQLDSAPPRHFELRPQDLPGSLQAASGTIPQVGVGLTSPLFLRHRPNREVGQKRAPRHSNHCPTFCDLFRTSVRTLARLFSGQRESLDADLEGLEQAAKQVPLVDHCYEPFRQMKWSNRSYQRYELNGVTGGGIYRDVPWALVPWLLWGGRLHTAEHRVAGAGSWRLVLD